MEFFGIDEFMRYLKAKFDESERKHAWRALTGRDHIHHENDTYIFTDQKVYQIKSSEVAPRVMAAVATEVGGSSSDMLELIKGGSPIPLTVASRSMNAQSIIMFGMQQYSSDIADVLRKDYYCSKQDALRRDLEAKLKLLTDRPEFRASYRNTRESQESYFV